MVCRTGDIEDEIHFLCHCEGHKDLRTNFIRYLEMNGHSTNLEGSDSIRDLFRTKKKIFLLVLENLFLNATEFGRPQVLKFET